MKIKKLKWVRHSGKASWGRWVEWKADLASFGRLLVTTGNLTDESGWTIRRIHDGGCDRLPEPFPTAKLAKQAAEAHWRSKLMEVLDP